MDKLSHLEFVQMDLKNSPHQPGTNMQIRGFEGMQPSKLKEAQKNGFTFYKVASKFFDRRVQGGQIINSLFFRVPSFSYYSLPLPLYISLHLLTLPSYYYYFIIIVFSSSYVVIFLYHLFAFLRVSFCTTVSRTSRFYSSQKQNES